MVCLLLMSRILKSGTFIFKRQEMFTSAMMCVFDIFANCFQLKDNYVKSKGWFGANELF